MAIPTSANFTAVKTARIALPPRFNKDEAPASLSFSGGREGFNALL